MGYLAISILCAVVTGLVAQKKNRNVIIWGVLGLLFGVIPVIILLFLRKLPPALESE